MYCYILLQLQRQPSPNQNASLAKQNFANESQKSPSKAVKKMFSGSTTQSQCFKLFSLRNKSSVISKYRQIFLPNNLIFLLFFGTLPPSRLVFKRYLLSLRCEMKNLSRYDHQRKTRFDYKGVGL